MNQLSVPLILAMPSPCAIGATACSDDHFGQDAVITGGQHASADSDLISSECVLYLTGWLLAALQNYFWSRPLQGLPPHLGAFRQQRALSAGHEKPATPRDTRHLCLRVIMTLWYQSLARPG